MGRSIYALLAEIGNKASLKNRHRPLRPSDWFEVPRADLRRIA